MKTVAVLGATGMLGKAVVDELIGQNISVKILVRDIDKFKSLYPNERLPGRLSAVQGDLDTNQSLADVLEYVDTIFLCFNTKYHLWENDMLRWIDKISKLAAILEARIVYPGCSINYGIKTDIITEEDAQDSPSEIGRLKIAIERRLYNASLEGAKLTIVRLPDLFGPAQFDSIIGNIFISATQNKTSAWRGKVDIEHEFLFSKDAAKVLVNAAHSDLTEDKVLHFAGERILIKTWIDKIYSLANADINPNYRIISKLTDNFRGLFSKNARYQNELRYLYETTNVFDNTLYGSTLGLIDLTPLEEALNETLEWYKYYNSRK